MRIKTKEVDRHFLTKHYLANLPRLPKPLQQYNATSKELVILYPLFRGVPSEPTDSELLFRIPAALWSKRSFLRHTDVMERSVAMKFYIEDVVWQNKQVKDYFHAEGVPDDDILTFSGAEIEVELPEGSQELYMGKQLCPYLDDQLRHWELVILLDADLFFCKTQHASGRFDFAKRVSRFPTNRIGVAEVFDDFPEPNVLPDNWVRAFGYNPDQWLQTAQELLKAEINISQIKPVSGCAAVLPRNYRNVRPYFEKYVSMTDKVFQSDEPVLGLWNYLNGGQEVYPIFRWLDLKIAMTEEHLYQFHHNPECAFYISHIISMWEQRWREHIGGDN